MIKQRFIVLVFAVICLITPAYGGRFLPCRSANNVSTRVRQADPLTFAAISILVTQTLQELQNVGITLGGNANMIVGNTSQELNNRLAQLRELVRDEVNAPIASLGLDVQELARQLTSSLERLNTIITTQRVCLYQNAAMVLSGISNIAQELKRPIPGDKTAPQVTHFQFDGSALPSSIPLNGGRLTVFGVGLWREPKLPPIVQLKSADRQTVIDTPIPQPAGANTNFSISLNGATIQTRAGECLQLFVQARHTEGALWWKKVVMDDLYLPMCISAAPKTEFVVNAEISYQVSVQRTEELGEQEFRADNSSCGNNAAVSGLQKAWILPHGGRIVSYRDRAGEFQRNGSNVNFSINGDNTIVANGSIDSPTCFMFKIPPFGPTVARLQHSTIFQRFVTPTVQYTATESRTAQVVSDKKSMDLPNTQVRLLLDKSEATTSTIFRFTVRKLVDGVQVGPTYDSSRVTVNNIGGTVSGILGNLTITGKLNPNPVSGKAELIVTMQAPSCD